MFVFKFQLIVAFCLINGRFAYKEYVADDAGDYVHGSSSNISHFNSNEPPGKKIFQNFIFIQNMSIFFYIRFNVNSNELQSLSKLFLKI